MIETSLSMEHLPARDLEFLARAVTHGDTAALRRFIDELKPHLLAAVRRHAPMLDAEDERQELATLVLDRFASEAFRDLRPFELWRIQAS
jgi:hypothetical protein